MMWSRAWGPRTELWNYEFSKPMKYIAVKKLDRHIAYVHNDVSLLERMLSPQWIKII